MAYDRSGLDQVGGVTTGAKSGVADAGTFNDAAQRMNRAQMDTEGVNMGPSANTERYGYNMHAVAAGKHTVNGAEYYGRTSHGEQSLVQGENDSVSTVKVVQGDGDELVSMANKPDQA